MKVLAVDQSFTSCGLFVLEVCDSDVTRVIHCERFVTNVNLDIFARAMQVAERVDIVATNFNIHHIAIEGLAFSKMGDATRDLAGLQFTIVNFQRMKSRDVLIIPPNTVKKIATGKGNAKKEQLYEALPADIKNLLDVNKYKKTTGRYDLTDAYWIGMSAIIEINRRENKNKKNT
jgi:Holliday junction resolvasome RuvABC endonuclease subunit